MIVLRPTNLHWIDGVAEPEDLCAHSGVEFRVDDQVLVAPDAGDWTVSASAVYLLRTLSDSHTRGRPVYEHLFPCCGFSMNDIEGQEDVTIVGCPNGIDFEVIRDAEEVVIVGQDGRKHRVAFAEWRAVVCAFSDAVRRFYDQSSPKQPSDEAAGKGFERFMAEWDRRRAGVDGSL